MPSSKTYWDGVCAEIEKKHKRVRDPYPPLFSLPEPLTPIGRTQPSDDIKFKISPPTPMHEPQKSVIKPEIQGSHSGSIEIDDRKASNSRFSGSDKKLKSFPTTRKKNKSSSLDTGTQDFRNLKIYSKSSCPHHKNITPVKIFDDEISKYLPKTESFVPELPIFEEQKVSCDHRRIIRSKSSPASSVSSKANGKSVKEVVQDKQITKAPKLGMASLLPSFAKAISIDSSVGTRESLDSEEEPKACPKVQTQTDAASSSNVKRRDFLRVPSLSFISSHPSFRKLSLVDSGDEKDISQQCIAVITKEEFLIAEKSLKCIINEKETSSAQTMNISKVGNITGNSIKIVSDYRKKYAYKALDMITKHKHPEIRFQPDYPDTEIVSPAEEPVQLEIKHTHRKLRSSKDQESSFDFKKIHMKSKGTANKYLSPNHRSKLTTTEVNENQSVTISSSSRSTSGASPDFEKTTAVIPPNDVLQEIPQTKVFRRAHIDRCHACLYKPFSKPTKVNRELPITTLKFVVDNPPNFRASSSSSSSTIEDLRDYLTRNHDADHSLHFSKDSEDLSEINIKNGIQENSDSKDYLRVSFDKSNLVSTLKRSVDTLSPTERSPSPHPQSDHQLRDKSLSIASTDRSKTSTPSNQSSDSDEGHPQEDKMPSSKYMAPCHAPVVWRPSFEPLRALKLRKAMSLKARAAAITAISSEASDSESEENAVPSKLQTGKQEVLIATETVKAVKKTKEKKEKKETTKKPLVRMKTVADRMTDVSSSTGDISQKGKGNKMLKRAKTTFDLLNIPDDSESDKSEEEDLSVETENVEKKEETLPFFDAIVMHRAGSPPPPIMSAQDIGEIVKRCLKENFSAVDLFKKLSEEFTKRIEEKYKDLENRETRKYFKLGLQLFKALVDSRRYLKSDPFDPNLEFSHKQPPLTNSRQLRRILPPKSYELVAPILGMPKYSSKKSSDDKKAVQVKNKSSYGDSGDDNSELTFDLVVCKHYIIIIFKINSIVTALLLFSFYTGLL